MEFNGDLFLLPLILIGINGDNNKLSNDYCLRTDRTMWFTPHGLKIRIVDDMVCKLHDLTSLN